jgi:hypothetical protein
MAISGRSPGRSSSATLGFHSCLNPLYPSITRSIT